MRPIVTDVTILHYTTDRPSYQIAQSQISLRYPGPRPGRRSVASWNLAYHALSSELAAS